MAGLAAGALAAFHDNGGLSRLSSTMHAAAVSQGLTRKSRPKPGAYYSGCNEARAAGVAPIYAGEPGYRPEMDGDGDGIACEPHRSFG
jgi:hypothetical protein